MRSRDWGDWYACQPEGEAEPPPRDLSTLCRKKFGPNSHGEAGYCTLDKEHPGECGWHRGPSVPVIGG